MDTESLLWIGYDGRLYILMGMDMVLCIMTMFRSLFSLYTYTGVTERVYRHIIFLDTNDLRLS